uniref:Uncharacterized protein n=1 Tax=Chenopodium quinoa TaxID=63459 RepID=A0A803MIN2_CHEQI
MLLFTWLSGKPGNHEIYFPNRILKGMEPSSRTRNPISWIKEAISSSENDIIAVSGVDTAVYFVFLSTAFSMMVLAGIVLLPSLLPLSITDHSVQTAITPPSNGTFQATALMSSEVRAEQFAVLVRDIPPPLEGETRKEQVNSYFKAIYQIRSYRSMVVTDNTKVNKMWEELEGYRKQLVRAETVYAQSKTIDKPEGIRPMNRIGFLGLCGKNVDTIEYCNEKINELISKMETEQKSNLKRQTAFFSTRILFEQGGCCFCCSEFTCQNERTLWTVEDAPEPRQLIWSNLSLQFYMREVRKYVVYITVALMVVFYMIPITMISAFTTLGKLVKLMPFIKPVVDIAPIRTVLEALSSSTCSHNIFGPAPKITHVFGLNWKGLPDNATFFLTYVALKFFVGYGLELSRLIPLIIFHLKKKYLCKTEAEVKEAWAPGDFGYATRALKVYVPSFESYGRMWPHMHARFLAALVLYQVTMIALDVVCHELKESPNVERVYRSFVPPSLSSDKLDGDHYGDA